MIRLVRLSSVAGTGSGVRVAVIDSGVHASHPHVQGVAGGVGIDPEGREHPDFTDRLGHGTAVAAAIREKAPEADIVAIKVFDRQLDTTGPALLAAIKWALDDRARLINLSLGTTKTEHEGALRDLVSRARASGALIVAAAPRAEARWLPGALAGVVSVEVDWTLARDVCRVQVGDDGAVQLGASGFPRPIPGVPPERNLKGLSFAVANATGFLARLASASPDHLLTAIAGVAAAESGTVPSS